MYDTIETAASTSRRAGRAASHGRPGLIRDQARERCSYYEKLAHEAQIARRRAELEVEECRRELAHAQRVATVGNLAASIVHELNQPLTSVLVNASAAERFLASDQPDLDEVRMILRDIIDDDRRAAEVIRRLRSLLTNGNIEPVDVDLNTTVTETLKMVAGDASRRGVLVDLELAEGLPLLRGDRIQLQQVVLNLVVNAMDAMNCVEPAERRIEIRTSADSDRSVRLEVCDNGAGIVPADAVRIFQPYFTTKADGLGMGLSIARSIVEAHGGRLWATNNPGTGATFCLSLPVKRGHGFNGSDG